MDDAVLSGSSFRVARTGPNGPEDYATIMARGASDGDNGPYTYTADASPPTLEVAPDPDDYDIRHHYEIRHHSDRTEIGVLARRPLTVQ